MWRHFPKVWARGEPYGPISGQILRNVKTRFFSICLKMSNGNLVFDFFEGRSEWKKCMQKIRTGCLYLMHTVIGLYCLQNTPDSISAVSGNYVIKWGGWSQNPFAYLAYSCLFLDGPLIYLNVSRKPWNRVPPPIQGYFISTFPGTVQITSKTKFKLFLGRWKSTQRSQLPQSTSAVS